MPVISPQPGFYREVPYEEATHLYIDYRLIKAPKAKEVTVDWLLFKINKEAVYQNLSQYLRKVFSSCVSVYPSSYGIGVASLFSREDDIKVVAEKLKSLGLKFRHERPDKSYARIVSNITPSRRNNPDFEKAQIRFRKQYNCELRTVKNGNPDIV